MFSKVMKRPLVYLFLATLGVVTLLAGWPNLSLALPSRQSDCIEQVIGSAEIVTSRAVDIDQDGNLDQVVLYVNDDTARRDDPIYILVILSQPLLHCEVVLNEYLVWSALTAGRQSINVREIEIVELTGDDKPELHIWLEKSGGGPRESVAYHSIFTMIDGIWQHALGDGGITQCLAFSSFEFRDTPSGDAQDIYLDEDRLCDPPWSSHRTYSILRWNGSKFKQIEGGTIDISTTDPPWLNLCCITSLIASVATPILIIRLRKKGQSSPPGLRQC
jgi:hypothetical protein